MKKRNNDKVKKSNNKLALIQYEPTNASPEEKKGEEEGNEERLERILKAEEDGRLRGYKSKQDREIFTNRPALPQHEIKEVRLNDEVERGKVALLMGCYELGLLVLTLVLPFIAAIDCKDGLHWWAYFVFAIYLTALVVYDIYALCRSPVLKELLDNLRIDKKDTCWEKFSIIFGYCLFPLVSTVLASIDVFLDFCFLAYIRIDTIHGTGQTSVYVLYIVTAILLSLASLMRMWGFVCLCRRFIAGKYPASEMYFIYQLFELKTQAKLVAFQDFNLEAKTQMYVNIYKTCVEDIGQFIIQIVYLVISICPERSNTNVAVVSLAFSIASSVAMVIWTLFNYCILQCKINVFRKDLKQSLPSTTHYDILCRAERRHEFGVIADELSNAQSGMMVVTLHIDATKATHYTVGELVNMIDKLFDNRKDTPFTRLTTTNMPLQQCLQVFTSAMKHGHRISAIKLGPCSDHDCDITCFQEFLNNLKGSTTVRLLEIGTR